MGRSKKWVHPNTKLSEIHSRYGGTCIFYVELAYRPNLQQGVHIRTIWSDVAFGGETGEERFQAWVVEQRKLGINVGSLDDDDDDETKGSNDNASIEASKEEQEKLLKQEFDSVWRSIKLDKYGAEMEIKKVSEYVYKYYVGLRDCFQTLSLSSKLDPPALTLPELTHFCWQHDLEQCTTGLRKTIGNDTSGEKAIQAKVDEEQTVCQVARLVCFGAVEEEKKVEDDTSPIQLNLPKFLEFLVRYSAVKRAKLAGSKKNSGSFANAIALRQMLQRLEAPLNRRRNEKTRKMMTTKSIARVIADTSDAVRDVYENYCTADNDKDRKNQRWQSTMSLHEFQLLMTDALLVGNRPADDGPQATQDSQKAFFSAQSNDEGSAVAFVGMNVGERAASSNVLEDLVFTEFLEAVVRVALNKWDDPEIPSLDKIQLANEAIAVLHQ